MGVAPLSAWGATLGAAARSLADRPAGADGGRRWWSPTCSARTARGALFGYGVVLLAGFVALYEIYRGAVARTHTTQEKVCRAPSSRSFARNRRRYGGFIVHLGITVIGIGVIGSTLVPVGDAADADGRAERDAGAVHHDLQRDAARSGRRRWAHDGHRPGDGQRRTAAQSRRFARATTSIRSQQGMNQMNIAGSYSTLEGDFYVLLSGWDQPNGATATFKIYVNPLINLIWWGGLILILGTVISVWTVRVGCLTSVRERQLIAKRAGALA